MDKTSDTLFLKKAGFVRPPNANITGSYESYKGFILFKGICDDCGQLIQLKLKGNTDKLKYDEEKTKYLVAKSLIKKHECHAIRDILASKPEKYFSDFRRGKEKKQEVDYYKQKAGIDTRDKPIDLKAMNSLNGGKA